MFLYGWLYLLQCLQNLLTSKRVVFGVPLNLMNVRDPQTVHALDYFFNAITLPFTSLLSKFSTFDKDRKPSVKKK